MDFDLSNVFSIFFVEEIQSSCKTVTWTKHQEYENYLKYHVKPKVKSFLEINQTGKDVLYL